MGWEFGEINLRAEAVASNRSIKNGIETDSGSDLRGGEKNSKVFQITLCAPQIIHFKSAELLCGCRNACGLLVFFFVFFLSVCSAAV